MSDSEMQAQLAQVFSRLEGGVCLTLETPAAPTSEGEQDLASAKEMIEGLLSCHALLTTQTQSATTPIARMGVSPQGAIPRVFFRGTPGGHEFSSLILAILHGDSKGETPG